MNRGVGRRTRLYQLELNSRGVWASRSLRWTQGIWANNDIGIGIGIGILRLAFWIASIPCIWRERAGDNGRPSRIMMIGDWNWIMTGFFLRNTHCGRLGYRGPTILCSPYSYCVVEVKSFPGSLVLGLRKLQGDFVFMDMDSRCFFVWAQHSLTFRCKYTHTHTQISVFAVFPFMYTL